MTVGLSLVQFVVSIRCGLSRHSSHFVGADLSVCSHELSVEALLQCVLDGHRQCSRKGPSAHCAVVDIGVVRRLSSQRTESNGADEE